MPDEDYAPSVPFDATSAVPEAEEGVGTRIKEATPAPRPAPRPQPPAAPPPVIRTPSPASMATSTKIAIGGVTLVLLGGAYWLTRPKGRR